MNTSMIVEKFKELRDVTADRNIRRHNVTDFTLLSRSALKEYINMGKKYASLISELVEDLHNMEGGMTDEDKQALFVIASEDDICKLGNEASNLVKSVKAKVLEASTFFNRAYNRTKNSPGFGMDENQDVVDTDEDMGNESEADSLMADRALEEDAIRLAEMMNGHILEDVIEVPVNTVSPPIFSGFCDVKKEASVASNYADLPRRTVTASTLFPRLDMGGTMALSEINASPSVASGAVPLKEDVPSWVTPILIGFAESQKAHAESQRSNTLMIQHLIARTSTEAPASGFGYAPRMKELSLAQFSGENPEEWQGWWSMFQVMVGKSNMAYEAKMAMLKNYVTKIARDAIDDLPLSKEGYQLACSILNKRFTFEGKCRNYALEKLKKLAVEPIPDNEKALTGLYYKQYACLQKMRIREVLTSVHVDWMKMPYPSSIQKAIRAKEIRFVQKFDFPMPVEKFMDMLLMVIQVHAGSSSQHEEVQRINFVTGRQQERVEERIGSSVEGRVNIDSRRREDWNCRLCGCKGHYEHRCTKFSTVADRSRVVKDRRLCNRCFSNKHLASSCTRAPCPKCKGDHGMAICPQWQDFQPVPPRNYRG